MPPNVRKLALIAHVAVSVGFSGAVAAFLALALAGLRDGSLYGAANLVVCAVIVPAGFAALVSGVVSSLGTPWGLVRYYWVVAKLVLTVVVLIVLLLQLPTIAMLADLSARGAVAGSAFSEARMALVIHASGGLAALILPLILSIYKPEGRLT